MYSCTNAERRTMSKMSSCVSEKDISLEMLCQIQTISLSARQNVPVVSLVSLTHAQAFLYSITAVSKPGPYCVAPRASLSQLFTGNFHTRGPAPGLTQKARIKRCPLRPWERKAGNAMHSAPVQNSRHGKTERKRNKCSRSQYKYTSMTPSLHPSIHPPSHSG